MVIQIVVVLFAVAFIWIMLIHIKEAWYDITHMEEYLERVVHKRELCQAKKEAIAEYNKKRAKLNAQGLSYRSIYFIKTVTKL